MKKILSVFLVTCIFAAFGGTVPVLSSEKPMDKTVETNGEIIVNGKLIEAPKPSVDGFNGVILVPLQPIAEALAIDMDWDGETKSARVGNLNIWIDKASYTVEGNEPVEFGPAPQLIDNFVFVPIHFFGYALKGYDARVSEGRVVINTKSELPAIEKTDWFNVMETERGHSMISSDGELIIHLNDTIPVFLEDGRPVRSHLARSQALAELLDGKKLTVTYSISTRSIPPQTTPMKIAILDETKNPLQKDFVGDTQVGIVAPIHKFTPEETEKLFPLNGEIVINGKITKAPAPYYRNGVVMVPLRVIAEAVGFDVAWNNELQRVNLSVAINLWIGKDYFIVGRMEPIKLDVAPEITDGHIYVPFTFFSMILSAYDIYAFEGQVVIGPAGEMR